MKTAMQEWFDELKANYPYMSNEIFDKGFNKYLEKDSANVEARRELNETKKIMEAISRQQ